VKFLIGAQLPARLAEFLNQAGHDAVHDHRAARILRPLPRATVATAAPAVGRFIPFR
jgi:hypothetical protein